MSDQPSEAALNVARRFVQVSLDPNSPDLPAAVVVGTKSLAYSIAESFISERTANRIALAIITEMAAAVEAYAAQRVAEEQARIQSVLDRQEELWKASGDERALNALPYFRLAVGGNP